MDTLLTEIMVLRELREIAQKAGTQLLYKEYHDRWLDPDIRSSEVTSQYLEQDSPQNYVGNRKVDDQSGDINQGSDKGS
jgi:hypothetical protein